MTHDPKGSGVTIDVFPFLFQVWDMPRKLRLEYDGAIYHVLSRGDRRQAIFLGDADRELFLRTLGEACKKTDWQIHAYCLMKNHFHLVIETPKANLSHGMQWLLGTYTAPPDLGPRLQWSIQVVGGGWFREWLS